MADYVFDDLIDAITQAVVRANQAAEQQYLRLLPAEGEENMYFERDEATKRLHAKTIEVAVPGPGHQAAHELIQVPIVSMIPMNSLQISDLTFEFQAYIAGIDEVEPERGKGGEKKDKRLYLALKKRMFRRQKEINVKITLKSTESPEGEVRINEEILKQISL